MTKIISIGIVVYVVFHLFSRIGEVVESYTISVGNVFGVLGAMVVWSVMTLMVYDDFNKK